MQTCGLCGTSFQFGTGKYEGKHIPRYNLTVCLTCWQGNRDGWAPSLEARVIEHLKNEGIKIPERNAAGALPRG